METKAEIRTGFVKECRDKGISVTEQRIAIYEDVRQDCSHPTAEEVYGRLQSRYPTLSLATVYKSLDLFETHGFVSKTRSTGEKARYDANRKPHHHVICVHCGSIEDIYDPALEALKLPESVQKRFRIRNYRIDFHGVCRRCGA